MLLERPDAVVADHPDDVHAVAGERVELHPGEAERPVAEQQHDLAIGPGELGRQRVARARPETPERPRVQPAAGLVAVHEAPGVGDEVAAVADHDRVAVEHPGELGVDPHRVQRGAFVVQLGLLGGPRARPRLRAARRSSGRPPAARPPAAAAIAESVAGDRPVALGGHRPADGCARARRRR